MTNDSFCVCFGLEYLDYSALHSNTLNVIFYTINRFTNIEELLKNNSSENVDKNENFDSVCFTQKKTDVGFLCYCTCSTEITIRTHCEQLSLELFVKFSGYSFVELLALRFTLRNLDCWHFF